HTIEVHVRRRHVGGRERIGSDRLLNVPIGSVFVNVLNLGILVGFFLRLEDRQLLHFAQRRRGVVTDRFTNRDFLLLSLKRGGRCVCRGGCLGAFCLDNLRNS